MNHSNNYAKFQDSNAFPSGLRAVIVDDEVMNLMILKLSLDAINSESRSFEDGKEAWDYISSHPNDIDIVLLDNVMPGMRGVEIIQAIRQQKNLRHIPIILQTGKEISDTDVKLLNSKHTYFISKPFDDFELIGVIKRAIEEL